ncbi:hypothetical protein [Paraburkholderia sp. Cy-641]|nr:hypothetical protein [Paraburkholderia sp. Cy-641]
MALRIGGTAREMAYKTACKTLPGPPREPVCHWNSRCLASPAAKYNAT